MAIKDKAAGSGAAGALILAVVALGLGFYAGFVMGGKQQWGVGYSAGVASAKKDLAARIDASLGAIPPAEDVKSVTGTVIEKTGDAVIIETAQLVRDPLAEPAPVRRTVRVTAGTTVTVAEPVPQAKLTALEAEFRAKQDAYLKDLAAGKQGTAPTAPSPLAEREGKTDDIAVGQEVTVTAKDGILRASTIDAVSIRIGPLTAAPAAPAASAGTVPSKDATAAEPPAPTAGQPATGTSAGTPPGAPAPLPPAPATDAPATNAAKGTK